MRTHRNQRRSRHMRAVRPPLRGGLNATPVVTSGKFLTFGQWARANWGERVFDVFDSDGYVADDGEVIRASDAFIPGVRLWVFRPVPDEPVEPIVLDVLAETEDWLAVDKPHNLATIPRGSFVARTVTVAARRQFGNDDLVPAHRLDAGTAGIVVLTKRPEIRGAYQDMFARREVAKTYEAIAPWLPGFDQWREVGLRIEKEHGEMRARAISGEPNAWTRLRVAEHLGVANESRDGTGVRGEYGRGVGSKSAPTIGSELAVWDLRPRTGKTHQLRVTLNYLGAPVANDPLFPEVLPSETIPKQPLQLLAKRLEFTDPLSGVAVDIHSRARLALRTL